MPEFASIAAYIVIDTFVLLMWHQILFVKICRETIYCPQLRSLIRYYLMQCRPDPLWGNVNPRLFQTRDISVDALFCRDTTRP